MDYIAVHITIEPFSEEWSEIVVAEIADLGYDSFDVQEPVLNAYIPRDNFSEPDLRTVLSGFASAPFALSHTVELIREQNWNAVWESDFDPVTIGGEVTLKAPYHKDLPKTRYNIVINPQMSFGSGHHQTTCMMVETLLELRDRRMLRGKSLLDMGCGTGVLAIVASKLGAAVPVHAIDIDPTCVRSSCDNARRNRVAHKIVIKCGDASLIQAGRYDIVLANINRNILLNDMSTYVRSLRPGGMLAISGFYLEDIPMLEAEAVRLGMEKRSVREKEGWAAVTFARKDQVGF